MEALSSGEEPEDLGLFGTETMAELCARQGRVADAVAIYQRLLVGGPGEAQRRRWTSRLADLRERAATARARAEAGVASARTAPGAGAPLSRSPSVPPPLPQAALRPDRSHPAAPSGQRVQDARLHLPLVVRHAVRAGQIIRAEHRDLIVLAPVNPGAELVADGNIHVYAPLRGRAFAGAAGHTAARIFCQSLDAELLGISGVRLAFEDLPRPCRGRPAQAFLDEGRLIVTAL